MDRRRRRIISQGDSVILADRAAVGYIVLSGIAAPYAGESISVILRNQGKEQRIFRPQWIGIEELFTAFHIAIATAWRSA